MSKLSIAALGATLVVGVPIALEFTSTVAVTTVIGITVTPAIAFGAGLVLGSLGIAAGGTALVRFGAREIADRFVRWRNCRAIGFNEMSDEDIEVAFGRKRLE